MLVRVGSVGRVVRVGRVGSVGSWFVWGDREHQRNNCSEIFLPLVCLKS
ncbi:MAG: hypothetical protein AB4080_26590 [Trichodesmium sp.]